MTTQLDKINSRIEDAKNMVAEVEQREGKNSERAKVMRQGLKGMKGLARVVKIYQKQTSGRQLTKSDLIFLGMPKEIL